MESRALPVEEASDVDGVVCFGDKTKALVDSGAAKSSVIAAEESFTMIVSIVVDLVKIMSERDVRRTEVK